ncbi:MAG TPA: serine/threonine-protein kinase [Polyangia bacterium]|jgi:serine/threonine-protein kinase
MSEPGPGDSLDQYQLTELLARSGMASIFKAIDTVTGEPVALKIPHLQFESDVVFFQRFRREEEIGQRLDHPNIVKVLTPRAKTRMYVAMELVAGRSLRAVLSQAAPLPTDQALVIARQVCEALVYLHAQGVVHRDLKPENILVPKDGGIKILDFGIALDESARRMTWAGLSTTIGTPDYMAPEQIAGRRGDARTDVYAVGTLLYEMLTGQLPFDAANPHALMRAKREDEPRPPSYHVPGIEPGLEAIILKAIERDPRDRYATAAELQEDLRDPAAVPPRDPARAPRRGGRGGRRWRRLLLPLVVLVVLAGLAALVWLSSRGAPGVGAPATQRVR